MAQRPNIDLSKLSQADKLILGGAGAFFIWSFLPFWYHYSVPGCSSVPGFAVKCSQGFNAWHSMTFIAALVTLLALIWTGLRLAGVTKNLQVNFPLAYVDLGLAGLAILFTLLGLVVKYAGVAGFSWGLIVGLLMAIVWGYGAYMKYQEPQTAGPTTPPPPSPGGFSA
jgi:hypothetical protein